MSGWYNSSMPELPEVETIRRGLESHLIGRKFAGIKSDNPKSFPNDEKLVGEYLIGATVQSVNRRAKILIIGLDNGYSLLAHLKMTGQLVFVSLKKRFGGGHPTDSLIGKLPDRSTRVTFEFGDASKLYFNDQRKFGWIRLIKNQDIPKLEFFQKVGPEPLEADFDFTTFKKHLSRRANTSIKAAILDQSVVAGVGNIYADESLHIARIHPATLVKDVSAMKLKRLHEAIQQSLTLSLTYGGSTDRNYVDVEGKRGNYLKFARVFRRQGLSCPDCGTIIKKIKVAGRGTHYCPRCQRQTKKRDKIT